MKVTLEIECEEIGIVKEIGSSGRMIATCENVDLREFLDSVNFEELKEYVSDKKGLMNE